METFDEKQLHEQFVRGRRLLDLGRYEEAILSFSILIEVSRPHLELPAAKVTFETSLNNRGKARCELGLERGDKDLFIKGLKDYEEAVAISADDKELLTAQRNLEFGRRQLEEWEHPRKGGFKVM